jgi:hypothetical protein
MKAASSAHYWDVLFLGGHCRERAVKSQSEATCYKTAIS